MNKYDEIFNKVAKHIKKLVKCILGRVYISSTYKITSAI